MTPGLINSIVNAEQMPTAGAVIQVALFPDDSARQIADLEQRLTDSEAAYVALCEYVATIEDQRNKLLQEVRQWQLRDALHNRVHIYGHHGIVRRS